MSSRFWITCSFFSIITKSQVNGPPVNINREVLTGDTAADAQPPFLLRWSPDFLAKHAPDVFSYNKTTNKLSLKTAHRDRPPWKTEMHHRQQDKRKAWLYCRACHSLVFGHEDGNYVPFADSKSQSRLKGLTLDDTALPTNVPRNLSQKWQRTVQRLSRRPPQRRIPGLDAENLVPRPDRQYWQNAPAAPFEDLCTDAAHGVLSCCNLKSSMLDHQDERGRTAYKCSAGETNFWRRQPTQISGTLAFMMGQETAEFGRVHGAGRLRAAEMEPLRECLQWLRANNVHLRDYFANAESFKGLYQQLQSLVPQGRGNTPVRLERTPRVKDAVESTLSATLGSEAQVSPCGLLLPAAACCSRNCFSKQYQIVIHTWIFVQLT